MNERELREYAGELETALRGARFGLLWIAHNEDQNLPEWARDIATQKLAQADAALSKKCCGDYLNCKQECAERGLAFNSHCAACPDPKDCAKRGCTIAGECGNTTEAA